MMQDMFGSVRRSLIFRTPDGDEGGVAGGLVERIGSCIRKSRVGLFSRPPPPALPPIVKDIAPPIRWRKGELIGCGAFGRVYMGMNLDSGELLAVKQVLIATNNASKEKAQAHIRELEEEVKLLKNLSHPNIVRYLGTAREEDTLNILLEFVPGGSISSLLGKFGPFPEAVIRMYTKQLLLGLEYLHKNGIMHRDIKGANILVDNKGCIKLADFGASKQVVELATISGAKSMKGTPYWMAPEVILQTGHSFPPISGGCLRTLTTEDVMELTNIEVIWNPCEACGFSDVKSSADIWSVGCTVIEMATGKPPWSQQYQEVAALFHIGTTKSHPPIPDQLSAEAKDFLLLCLQKEPNLRPIASELLQHPFVTGKYRELNPEKSGSLLPTSGTNSKNSFSPVIRPRTIHPGLKVECDMGSVRCSTIYPEKFSETGLLWARSNSDDDMCQIDDNDTFVAGGSEKFKSVVNSDDFNKSFNPMCEPSDGWPCKFDESPEPWPRGMNLDSSQPVDRDSGNPDASVQGGMDFTFPCGPSVSEDDDEVTETKIIAFLGEKALDLKKLQTPLYEEYYNTMNGSGSPSVVRNTQDENSPNYLKLPPKSRSPSRVSSRTPHAAVDVVNTAIPQSCGRRVSHIGGLNNQTLQEVPPPELNELKGLLVDDQQEPISLSASFSERQRKWKEELDQELERKREMIRQAGGGKTSSPKDRALNRTRDRLRFASPSK